MCRNKLESKLPLSIILELVEELGKKNSVLTTCIWMLYQVKQRTVLQIIQTTTLEKKRNRQLEVYCGCEQLKYQTEPHILLTKGQVVYKHLQDTSIQLANPWGEER